MNDACSNFSELLVEFADGELDGEQHRRVAEHLSTCAACRAELRQLERSLEFAKAEWRWAACPIPANFRPRRWPAIAARAAACIACMFAAGTFLLPRPKPVALPSQAAFRSDAIAAKPMSDAEITDYIEREARAARLAVSAKLLASQPGLENYAASAERYLAKVNPGN